MYCYTCESGIESVFSCIYEAWASGNGHTNIRIETEPVEQYTLFDTYIHVDKDPEKVEKVIRALRTRISEYFYGELSYAALSTQEDAPDILYRIMILGFAYGPQALQMYQYREVARFWEIRRGVKREVHLFPEFMRFARLENGLLVAHFEPHNLVLIPVSWHFEDRMPSENWIIVDDVHRMAVIHPADEESMMLYLTTEEYEKLQEAEKQKDIFTRRWQIFFEHIAIAERKNPTCQRNLFPKWMRKHVTEFNNI